MERYRLLVKQGKKWKIGINVYASVEDAKIRTKELNDLGIKTKLSDYIGTEIK